MTSHSTRATKPTDTDPDPLTGLLEGHRRWLDRLDISLVRHGVRLTSGPRTRDGNKAGTYPAPPPTVPAPAASRHWLLDRAERDGGEAQPYRDLRRDTLAPCRVCLVRSIDAHNAGELVELAQMHPKLVFLCADCRDLALEVARLASERDRVDTPHTLEAFFRYVLPIDGPSLTGITDMSTMARESDPNATAKHPITFARKGE